MQFNTQPIKAANPNYKQVIDTEWGEGTNTSIQASLVSARLPFRTTNWKEIIF